MPVQFHDGCFCSWFYAGDTIDVPCQYNVYTMSKQLQCYANTNLHMITDCLPLRLGLCDGTLFNNICDRFLSDEKWRTILVCDAEPQDRIKILEKNKAASKVNKEEEEKRTQKKGKKGQPIASKPYKLVQR